MSFRPDFTPHPILLILHCCTSCPADVPVLFSSLGSANSAALLNTVVVGAVNVGSTLIAVMFSDKFGRRFLLIEGGIQCCLAMVSENPSGSGVI